MQSVEDLREKIIELYVMARYRYLEQFDEDFLKQTGTSYLTRKFPLYDSVIDSHLKGSRTVGILLGEKAWLTKFICFDVDVGENPAEAEEVTKRLVSLLIYHYGIDVNDIHVSDSGSKGYHVELFFDSATPYTTFEPFYYEVLDKLGEHTSRIELRPTNKGVKIPLGIHRISGKKCYYVDTLTLEPIKDLEHIFTIKQMEFQQFEDHVLSKVEDVDLNRIFKLSEAEAKETDEILNRLDLRAKSVEAVQKDIIAVLKANRLLYKGTRHIMTLQIAKFFYWQGEEAEATKDIIADVIMNTWNNHRDFISADTSVKVVLSDIERTVNDVYAKGYKLVGGQKEIEISKAEILQILGIKSKESRRNLHLKKLMFSILIHSKRHKRKNNIFYMSYSSMTRMGNTENRTRLKDYIDELEQLGLMKVVSRLIIDQAKSKELKAFFYFPNEYQVTFPEPQNEDEKATTTINTDVGADSLFEIIPILLTEKEAKKILPKSQYYKTGLKEAYEKKDIV